MTNQIETNPSYKIIADHLRSSSFLIADGVLPANEGRGYVLRRIMRRAMRHIHQLSTKEPLMHKLVPILIKETGEAYPELLRAKDLIIDTLKIEEERFQSTVGKGMELLKEELVKLKKDDDFSGEIAFKLYDTFGFPLDLTQDILKEQNIKVDIKSFDSRMEQQKKRARQSWSGSGEQKDSNFYFELKKTLPKTKFLGYETTKSGAKILTILKNGKPVGSTQKGDKNIEIILDQTPFYATSGGQKGDDGNIILESESTTNELFDYQKLNNVLDVSETKKVAEILFVHCADDIRGEFKVGDKIIALVNNRNRQFRAQNHSATHLLHAVLRQILGNHIVQKGSNVDSEYLTFDFNHNKAISGEELEKVEDLVNFYIRQNSKVTTEILSIDKAREKGAVALFGEKYDDEVRVLSMAKAEQKNLSIELCGGTHTNYTGNIGVFKIISEKGIAAGIRRIEAKTGYFALEYLKLQQKKLESLLEGLKIKQQFDEIKIDSKDFHGSKKGFDDTAYFSDEILQNGVKNNSEIIKITEIIQQTYNLGEGKASELKNLGKEIDKIKQDQLSKNIDFKSEDLKDFTLMHHIFNGISAKDLREIASNTKNTPKYSQKYIIIFFGIADGKVSATLSVSSDLINRFPANKLILDIAQKIGGKGGGGKADLAMCGGDNKDGIKHAINCLKMT